MNTRKQIKDCKTIVKNEINKNNYMNNYPIMTNDGVNITLNTNASS